MITREGYFKNLGFKNDPFYSTNAEHEEFLNEYFINPPYFSSLIGSLDKPKSSIVVAPRGFGKTAQRRRFEKIADDYEDEIICIVYDSFPIEGITNLKNINLDKHLEKIIKSLLITLLSKVHETHKFELDAYERRMLLSLIETYMSDITPMELKKTIDNIKGMKGKLNDLWITASKPIGIIINILLKAKDLGSVDLDMKHQKPSDIMPKEYFQFLQDMFSKIGFKGIYILIDKIDENHLTGNDSLASYNLIKPLIKDINLLEGNKIVFKFFLWDKISEHWTDDIRLDRIQHFKLEWEQNQIKEMINTRLKVLSDSKFDTLEEILNCNADDIEDIFLFAQNSPRDSINILNYIFDIHINRLKDVGSKPDRNDIYQGIDRFCENKFNEIVPDKTQQANLKRLKMSTFTIPKLGNDIFKVNENTIRNIIMPWTRAGFVITLSNKVSSKTNKRQVNLYSVNDIVIARHICSNQPLGDFIKRNVHKCNDCGKILVFDRINNYGRGDFNCPFCQYSIKID